MRKSERKLKQLQRKHSRSQRKSKNKIKRQRKLARKHERVSNQRKDFAVKTAKCVVTSNDVVVVESLLVANMLKNRKLAKSISDASWARFLAELERYAQKLGKILIKVNPAYTSQSCSSCGCIPERKLTLANRTYICKECGLILDRDINAAINLLRAALVMAKAELSKKATAGHVGSWSFVCKCIEDALVESELQYVFRDQTSTQSAEADCACQIVEEETTQQTLTFNSLDFSKNLENVRDSGTGIPRLQSWEDVKQVNESLKAV